MNQIPFESLNLPSDISYPLSIIKNGQEVARVIGGEQLQADKKMASIRLRITLARNAEEAKKNGMTQEILDDLLKDIS